jgi:hypothetical protein
MLEKLLRARLPEQIVALIEKLEQDPDASHLHKVEKLLNNGEAVFTRYEHWALKRAVRKCRTVILREETLNHVMRIVINEPAQEKTPEQPYASRLGAQLGIQGAGMSLQQYGMLHQQQVQQAQLAAQQARNIAQGHYTDARSLYNGTRL